MRDLIESIIAKGIVHNQETGLCVFEFHKGELK